MNMQAMMKQVQKIQKEMMDEKNKIDNEVFEVTTSFVTAKMKGTRELIEIKIDNDDIKSDEIELLEDMILVTVNNLIKKIDDETEKRLGKYTKGMPGLF